MGPGGEGSKPNGRDQGSCLNRRQPGQLASNCPAPTQEEENRERQRQRRRRQRRTQRWGSQATRHICISWVDVNHFCCRERTKRGRSDVWPSICFCRLVCSVMCAKDSTTRATTRNQKVPTTEQAHRARAHLEMVRSIHPERGHLAARRVIQRGGAGIMFRESSFLNCSTIR